MHEILTKIITAKRQDVARSKSMLSEADIIKEVSSFDRRVRSFKSAIKGKDKLSLIAEVKQASPSKGIIRKDFNPVEIAKIYQMCNASAISVLTEENYFKGSLSDLREVREAVELPILRKDFLIDTYQVYESYLAGADCILLIAKIVAPVELARMFHLAKALGMDALVEVHDEKELDIALNMHADIIGINNRDLEDFSVNMDTVTRLAILAPRDKVIVAESGIKSNEDLQFLRGIGVDAVLIGEAFLKEEDIEKAVNDIWY